MNPYIEVTFSDGQAYHVSATVDVDVTEQEGKTHINIADLINAAIMQAIKEQPHLKVPVGSYTIKLLATVTESLEKENGE